MDDAGDGCGQAVALEGLVAAQHFIEDETEGKNVGASVVGLLEQDFGSHVGGSAAGGGHGLHAFCGVVGIAVPGAAGYAEVENLHAVARGEHDVFGFDVAVNDAFFVGGLQSVAALSGDGEKFVGGDGPFEAMAEGFAFDELHHDPEFTGVFDDVVDGTDVWVIERGGTLGFFEQALAICFSGIRVRGHALDGHKALERGVFRAVNLSHAAGAEAPGNYEAAYGGAGEGIRGRVGRNIRRGRLDQICHRRSTRRISEF